MSKIITKVALVTPTYNRDHFLAQTLQYVLGQITPHYELHWFVADDSAQPSQHESSFKTMPNVSYFWQAQKQSLGSKRNLLNQWACDWGAEFICSLDDDDWYGSNYVADMVQLLINHPEYQFAGSSEDYYYDVKNNRILKIDAVNEHSSCNGVLCYRASITKKHSYNPDAKFAEESSFLHKLPVIQNRNIQQLHLALAHDSNTVTKKNYTSHDKFQVNLALTDFPMSPQQIEFYLNLHSAAQK